MGNYTQVLSKARLLKSTKRCCHVGFVVRIDKARSSIKTVSDVQSLEK